MEKKTKQENLTKELTNVLEEIVEETPEVKEDPLKAKVTLTPEGNVLIEDKLYGLVYNYRNGFDPEELGKRYSEVLNRYDYIVGDWGYEQLRLKGFFDNDHKKAAPDQKIATLQDYIYEYCNFGCRYFVLEKVNKKREKPAPKKKRRPKKTTPYVEEKVAPVKKQTPVIHRKKSTATEKATSTVVSKKEGFTIRKRED